MADAPKFDPSQPFEEVGSAPAAQAAPVFDPSAPFEEVASPSPTASISAADSVGRAASQGATFGMGDELSAGASALFPTETDRQMGRGFGDRLQLALDDIRKKNTEAHNANPVVSTLTEIGASVPLSIATGGAAGGVLKTATAAGAQGAAYGLGKSEKRNLGEAAVDTAKAGILSFGIAGGLGLAGKFFKELPQGGLSGNVDEFGNVLGKNPLKVSESRAGDLSVQYGKGAKDAFKIGREMQTTMSDPNVQASVVAELNAQQGNINALAQSTKQKLGTEWESKLAEHGSAPVNLNSTFKKVYNKIKGVAAEGDEITQAQQQALLQRASAIEDQLRAASPTKSLDDVPLGAIAEAQEALGNIVYQQGAYTKSKAVHGAAKNFHSDLAKAFNLGDETAGSGGELSAINKVFSTLFKMEEHKLSGATLKALTDPQAAGASQKYINFVKPFVELDPAIRTRLAPELEKYLSQDFQKALTKAQVMRIVTNRGGQNVDSGKTLLSLAGLKSASGSTLADFANKAGVFLGEAPPPAAFGTKGLFNISTPRTIAPALGTAIGVGEGGAPALNDIK